MNNQTYNLRRAIKKEASINIEDLRRAFLYDPMTGSIKWKKPTSARCNAGDEAGCSVHRGYRVISFQYNSILAHRMAWALHYGEWPCGIIDHINGQTSDNRIANLRIASHRTNVSNQIRHRQGRSPGVYQTHWGRWEARYQVGRQRVYVGCFDTEDEAAQARSTAMAKENLL